MASKIIDPIAFNNAVELYNSGHSVKECAKITGITEACLYGRFHKMGITSKKVKAYREKRDNSCKIAADLIKKGKSFSEALSICGITSDVFYRGAKRLGLDVPSKHERVAAKVDTSNIVSMFKDGIGVGGIAERIGTSPSFIKTYLNERGYEIRNRSQQQSARMRRSSPEQIASLTKAAHNALRGRKVPIKERICSAQTKEGKINKRSKYEKLIFPILRDNFPDVVPSKAIHTYNADFAIGKVTVEVFGGGWSISDRKRISRYIRRCKDIGNRGFHTVFFIAINESKLSNTGKLIETINLASLDPSPRGKYWMVWGDSEGSSGFCDELDDSAFISPFVNVTDPATGRYVSVPRDTIEM
jgi:predicted transcriptional regulator